MRAADFLDTVGVNTHIGSDPYNDPAQLWSMLAFLGTAHVRQSSPTGAADLAAMGALGALGARIDLIVNGGGPVDLDGALGTVRALAPYLDAVEGVNEAVIFPITYRGITGVDAAAALQKDLYAAVRADPALAGAAVYMFTLGGVDPGAYPSLGDLSADTDFANVHSYPPHGLRPIFVIHAAIDGGRTDAPSRPVVLTETGYYTLPGTTGWGGVPDAVQASYLLDLLLDEAAAGVHRTYLYDLIDDGADPGGTNQEDHFGLFRFDGTPKPAAIAIHTLSVLLADAGPASRTFQADGLPFTAAGVPYNYTGNTLALDKSDGTHVIAVWNEEQLWNTDTQTAIPAQHVPVTVTLASAVATVLVYDPLVGTDPVQTLHNVSSVALDITDHPLLVVVPPDPPAVSPTPDPPQGPPQGELLLAVSEDAWQGDAQFTVSVDGQQVGGTQTATASHAAGQSQTLALQGAFGTAQHTVAVTFLNDAYAGTAATDRNLYVDAITDGALTTPGAALLSNGTASFLVGTPPVVTVGAGASKAVLFVSEDAWQGDAQFTVRVDGQQVGGTQTAAALHGTGQTQEFDILGAFTPGAHQVAVTFLNDAYAGTAATDRNLYVDKVGTVAVNSPLYSSGTQSFAATVVPAS